MASETETHKVRTMEKEGEGILNLTERVLGNVRQERERQNKLYGLQRHDINKWQGILIEEVGEVAQVINGINFPRDAKFTDASDLYEELIQVSAVAVAIAEQILEDALEERN